MQLRTSYESASFLRSYIKQFYDIGSRYDLSDMNVIYLTMELLSKKNNQFRTKL